MTKHLGGEADESHENVCHGDRWKLMRSLTFRIKTRIEVYSNVTVVHKERERERGGETDRQTDRETDREYYRCI